MGGILGYGWTPSVEAKDVLLCSLEISLLLSRALEEIRSLGDHSLPHGHDLIDGLPTIYERLVLPPIERPNDLSHRGHLKPAPSDHLEDEAGKSGVNETPRVKE
ncbi:hypothetical protein CRG98_027835 [Punica granatum]|uniref:Uncharacterized protein n=1 Tax=Punica granatum TaxID=22663 RepID=A0A2I0J6D7_PUNGR|nr:hypothetical protein CRG98_027835 [Punica granatum]